MPRLSKRCPMQPCPSKRVGTWDSPPHFEPDKEGSGSLPNRTLLTMPRRGTFLREGPPFPSEPRRLTLPLRAKKAHSSSLALLPDDHNDVVVLPSCNKWEEISLSQPR
ncbi:hypothetical protein ACLOJK_014737 [Asimina triloba]